MLVVTWDEKKRLANIRIHGFDFVGCEAIWDDFTITREDIRQRHIISRRKAEKYEARYYIAETKKFQGEG